MHPRSGLLKENQFHLLTVQELSVEIKFSDRYEHRKSSLLAVSGNQAFRSSGSLNRIRGICRSHDRADIYSSDMAVDSSDWLRTRCSCLLERKTGCYYSCGLSWEAKFLGFPVKSRLLGSSCYSWFILECKVKSKAFSATW